MNTGKLIKLVLGMVLAFLLTHAYGSMRDNLGNQVTSATFKGKWVIVNYWADWCDGCLAEIPELNNFYSHNQDKNIVLYGVNYDQLSLNSLQTSIKKNGILFPVLTQDPSSIWHLGPIDLIPVTFIINPQGKLAKTIMGPSTEQTIKQVLYELQA